MTIDVQPKASSRSMLGGATRSHIGSGTAVNYLSPGRDEFDAAAAMPTRRRAGWESRYLSQVIAIDLIVAMISGPFGFLLRFDEPGPDTRLRYLGFATVLPLLWVLLLAVNHAYEQRFLYAGSEETRRVFRTGMMLVAGVTITAYAFQQNFSRGYMLGSFPLLIVGTAIGRYVLRKRLHHRRIAGACM